MGKAQALLDTNELAHYVGLESGFSLCTLHNIRKVEVHEFRDCLGIAFYDYLLENLMDYPCDQYAGNTTYQVGDIVTYKGVIYEAVNITTALPSNCEDWQPAPKFNSDCLNELWCEGSLAEYLSFAVLKNRVPYIYTQISDTGLLKKFGDGYGSIDSRDYRTLLTAIDRDIAITFENLDVYIKTHNHHHCYDLYKGLAIDCCGECGCKKEECSCGNCVDIKKRKNRYRIG